ncbi:inner membrane yhjD domain protein [Yersinia rochesterensis]|uniref:Inner membrane yhjD domain protein n=1 Tax=Yersinia rochesterensis TaxID=1604335 RepID=A0ABM5SML4_9GAMM|nr:inner membrane YhjD domain protein [Yersinia rochesterensis]AJI87559.1 inner membrane yhjD domain protein [Yersinia frederiksenii Y225]AJJ35691.1 inner membrane yhjD domain protein [Yersinia rochesterensis]CNH60184.1 inner membrane protein YhjD [Yersinia kristensenii]CRY61824.1 inner membrane protein YhjD [Yersinia kristensenii]
MPNAPRDNPAPLTAGIETGKKAISFMAREVDL